MSSPKGVTAKARRSKSPARPASRSAAKPAAKVAAKPLPGKPANGNTASAEAVRLAAEIERSLANGQPDVLTAEALQALMAAACKTYAAQIEGGNPVAALAQRTSVTPTEVMVTASGLLRAANLAVFELGMWQSWTGR
jgi:hypothetical protein